MNAPDCGDREGRSQRDEGQDVEVHLAGDLDRSQAVADRPRPEAGKAGPGSPSGDVQYSTGGVAIIAGEALAAAETPPEAVSYAASLLRGG